MDIVRIGWRLTLVLGVAAALSLVTVTALTWSAASDYASARPCSSGAADPRNCYTEQPATVLSLSFVSDESRNPGAGSVVVLRLRIADATMPARVMQSAFPRVPLVGDRLTAKVWRGNVVALTANGWTVRTLSNPRSARSGPP